LIIIALSGCTEPVPVKKKSEETIKIGLILPMQGDLEAYGVLSKRGIDLLVDEVNSTGGVLGRDIEVIPGDDASNPNGVPHIATEYTRIRKVSAIVGPFTDQSALVAAPIANRDGVPLITIRSSEPNITTIGKYIFRACYVDAYQGTVLGRFAGRDLKAKRAAIIYNSGDQSAKQLIDNFRRAFASYDGEVALVQAYDSNATDFTEQLKEVAKVKPEVMLLTDFDDKSGVIMKKAADMGIKCTFLGTDFWNTTNLVKVAGPAAEGSYFTAHFSADDPNKKVREFIDLYKGDYVAEPEASAALSYDAISLIVEAIKRANSVNPEKIRAALAGIKKFEGVTGTYSFDDERNPVKGGIIMKVKNGRSVFEKRIEP
jgi:branched-chain amino acid transport system substrate-binding protein